MRGQVEAIKVFIRFRGFEPLQDFDKQMWKIGEDGFTLRAPPPMRCGVKKNVEENNTGEQFTFDRILDDVSQEEMYKIAARETVSNFTGGYNGTIFAYGQSGSGKTFCMLGPDEVVSLIKGGQPIAEEFQKLYGVIPRAIRDFFEYMNSAIEHDGAKFEVAINYFEIYKESLNDLLSTSKSGENLTISNDKVLNAEPSAVKSPADIFKLI